MRWVKRASCGLAAVTALAGLMLWTGWMAFETDRTARGVAYLNEGDALFALLVDGSPRARVYRVTGERRQLVGVIRGHAGPVISGDLRNSDQGPVAITQDLSGRSLETSINRLQHVPSIERETFRAVEPAWRTVGRPLAALLRRGAAILASPLVRRVDPARAARWAAERGAPIGQRVFRDCAACPEMVVVPAGSFLMGSPEDEAGRDKDEGPQLRVTIEAPLAIARFESTVAEFRRFIEATRYNPAGRCFAESQPGANDFAYRESVDWRASGLSDNNDNHPVVCVSWQDAQAYVSWLSAETGETYRLLSEAEWEYSSRAGSVSPYSFGEDPEDVCVHGNGADASASAVYAGLTTTDCDDGYVRTAPVGTFTSNAFGLHDLHGNVFEWVEDCYREGLDSQPGNASADRRGDCSLRVLRGGSWNNDPQNLRSAYRSTFGSRDRSSRIGFRVARTLVPPAP